MVISEAATASPPAIDSAPFNDSDLDGFPLLPPCTCVCPVQADLFTGETMSRIIENAVVTTLATMSILMLVFGLGKVIFTKLNWLVFSQRGNYDAVHPSLHSVSPSPV